MRIAVLTRPDSWHFRELKRACSGRHEIECVDFSTACVGSRELAGDDSVFTCGSVTLNHFDCVITRAIPAGRLEQIVFRMDWLFQLEQQLGIPVVNSAKCIEVSVDKYLCLEKLRAAGVQVPETRVSQTVPDALHHFKEFCCDTVVKPIFGSQGRGIARVEDRETACTLFEQRVSEGHVIYQQRFIKHGESDLRLLVIGQKVFGMSRYRQGHWVTNASQGARCGAHQPTAAQCRIAIDSARAVGALVAGVDVVYENQQPYVVEVNSCPAWQAISKVLEADIASEFIELVELEVGLDVSEDPVHGSL